MAAPIKFDVFQRIVPIVDESQGDISNDLPAARSGHRVVTDDYNLYSIGGYNPNYWGTVNTEETNYPLFKELWKFNFSTRKWTKMKTYGHFPNEMASHSAVLYGHSLVVFGGTGIPFGEASSNDMYVCNLRSKQWQHISCGGELPTRGYGHSMNIVGHHIYVTGGTTGWEYNCDIHRLNLQTKLWEECLFKGDLQPYGRYRHEAVYHDKKIFIFGGGQATRVYDFEKVPAFDLETYLWDTVSAQPDGPKGFPAARRCHSCVQLRNCVYICGGYNGLEIFGDIWKLDLRTFHWKKLEAQMPEPVYFHSAAITESGCMIIHGGVSHIDDIRTSSIYCIWVELPSLRDICWQYILHQHPGQSSLLRQPIDKLRSAGVPVDLLNSIHS